MAELAFGFPAAGAIVVAAFRSHGAAVLLGFLLGVAGLVALALVQTGATANFLGLRVGLAAPAQVVVAASFVAAGFAVLLVPPGADRAPMLASVLAGLAALVAMAEVADPLVLVVVLVVLAAFQSALPAHRAFADRLRAPVFGALLIALGALLATQTQTSPAVRLGGLAIVLGVTAAIGVAPYLQVLDPREPAPASPVAWLAFIGPGLAVVLSTRLVGILPEGAAPGYAAVLLGLGIFNVLLGVVGGWRSREAAGLWRYSLVGDWGLAMVGLGLLDSSGSGAAYLILLGILLLRLPLYLLALPALVQGRPAESLRPLMIVAGAALFGSAPFLGFPARLLLLRASTAAPWPLTAFLVLAMLAWLPQSLRLAQSLGRPSRRLTAGMAVILLPNLVLGLYPGPVLTLLGGR